MIAAIVLAAGEASRFGGPKQRLLLPEILERIGHSVDDVVVVEGAHPVGDVVAGARVVNCTVWQLGPGASLSCGLAALNDETEAAVVILGDGPDLAPEAVARVIEGWRKDGGEVVAASYHGVRGHPLVVARAAWSSIPLEGLRNMAAHLVPCDDLGSPGDVDHPDDLPERLRTRNVPSRRRKM